MSYQDSNIIGFKGACPIFQILFFSKFAEILLSKESSYCFHNPYELLQLKYVLLGDTSENKTTYGSHNFKTFAVR